jgi:Flp pilus assembly protein TadB
VIATVGIALAFAMGVEPRRLLLLAGAVHLPLALAALIGLHWYRSRPDDSARPSLFCLGVASELRAGASLRDALTTAATSVGIRASSGSTSGSPTDEVAARLAEEFPAIGPELELTVLAAARSGADSAALFDEIGALAIAQSEIRREVSIATAPGRATALVLVGAPVIYLITRLGSGGLSPLLESPEQRIVSVLGLGLFLIGVLATGAVMWRSAR